MKITAFSMKGPGKSFNEDRVTVNHSILEEGLLSCVIPSGIVAVADGVGGNAGGAVASHFEGAGLGDIKTLNSEAIEALNDRLLLKAISEPEHPRMASTLAGVEVREGTMRWLSIGNSRVYSMRNGKYLYQLSEDDTTAGTLVRQGRMSPEEAMATPNGSELVACMGGGSKNFFKVTIKDVPYKEGSVFLLTSDGVHEFLDADEIEEIVVENGIAEDTCRILVEEAKLHGSMDDRTAVLIQI